MKFELIPENFFKNDEEPETYKRDKKIKVSIQNVQQPTTRSFRKRRRGKKIKISRRTKKQYKQFSRTEDFEILD